ncbi:MAG: transposase [Planctomycetota bacterium]
MRKDSSGGFQQCYNTKIAVDESAQVIVGTLVTQSASDARQVLPLVEASIENTEQEAEKVLADAGSRSEANVAELEDRGIKGFVPPGREGKAHASNSGGPATRRMGKRMDGSRRRSTYKKRKHIVEPVFGWSKQVLGFRSCS